MLFFLFVLVLHVRHTPAQVSFTALGELGPPPGAGFRSDAFGISGDGLVVVGRASSDLLGGEAFRWTAEGGMVGLGSLPAVIPGGRALAASHDASVIVGSANFGAGSQAFRWTAETGMVGLGTLSGGIETGGGATSTSADGSVVVGLADNGGVQEAFRWTATTGMMPLADRPPNHLTGRANDVSAAGSVIVGTRELVGMGRQAFRWTAAEGLVPLAGFDDARAVSADGSIIVGNSGGTAVRWMAMGGIVPLGDLPGGMVLSNALDVSADGSVIVGASETDKGLEAMFWTQQTGIVNLRDSLISQGITDLTGWRLISAESVSADGRTVAGTGENPAGLREGWVATIPEPSTWILAVLAALVLIAMNLRKTLSKRTVTPH